MGGSRVLFFYTMLATAFLNPYSCQQKHQSVCSKPGLPNWWPMGCLWPARGSFAAPGLPCSCHSPYLQSCSSSLGSGVLPPSALTSAPAPKAVWHGTAQNSGETCSQEAEGRGDCMLGQGCPEPKRMWPLWHAAPACLKFEQWHVMCNNSFRLIFYWITAYADLGSSHQDFQALAGSGLRFQDQNLEIWP